MRTVVIITFLLALVSPASATIWCADAVNGNDANSGVAAGTLPSLTNCKKSAEAAAAILTSNDTLYMTGVFHHPNITDAAADMMAIPASAANVTITSFGPILWPGPGADAASDASVSAILMGTYCLGTAKLSCSTMQNAPATWTLVSGSIYSTPTTNYIYAVYSNDIQGWPDGMGGLKQAGCMTGPCVDSVTNPSQLSVWLATHTYAANSDVQNGTTPAQWWHTTTGGTSASTPPTCASSCTAGTTTFTDNTITWIYEGNSAAVIGPMVAGSYYSNGQVLNVWEPDSSNPNTNVVEAAVQPYPIHVNTTTGNNGLTVTHIGMKRFSAGPLIFDTSGSGACQAGFVFDRDYLTQTGTSNVDVGMFLNGFRFSGGDPTCVPAPTVTHSYISYIGEHGGCITGQVVGGGNFSYNNISQCNHGNVNLTQNGTTNPGANVTIYGNYLHDSIKSQNANIATDSVSGIYSQYTTGLKISNNVIARFLDAGCGGGGQCAGILLAATTNSIVTNNTISGVQHALAESTTGNTSMIFVNNICDNVVSEGTTGTCFNVIAAANLTKSNDNILPGTNAALVNGVITTFVNWQNTYGFDPSSFNASATFQRKGQYPFDLAPNSIGIGSADLSQGNGPDIGAKLVVNRSPLPLQTQSLQIGY